MFDAIVIGSGFGGAVAACRLAEAGQKVLVLERGRRWATAEFPRAPDDARISIPTVPSATTAGSTCRVFRESRWSRGRASAAAR